MNLSDFRKSRKSNRPHYLLFGYPIEHSWSPLMHNLALDYYDIDARYYAVSVENHELNDLAAFLNSDHFLGANVTIPYKQLIMDYIDRVDATATEIGAVNTIIKEPYRIEGTNTDYAGFMAPLEEYQYTLEGTDAVVFGTGGATRAIVIALQDLGLERIFLVSRSPQRNSSVWQQFNGIEIVSYQNWTSFMDEVQLVVNATPLGMYPDTGDSPVRDTEKGYLGDRICYDIVYNPVETMFLKQSREEGAQTINGLEMLIQQGSKSFQLWTGKPFPLDNVRRRLHEEIKH